MTDSSCRLCLETTAEAVIAPCRCAGSSKWVHRTCLDQWRAVSPRTSSFYECDVCHFKYVLEVHDDVQTCARMKFVGLVFRDFLGAFIALNLIVLVLGGIVEGIARPDDKLVERVKAAHWLAERLQGGALKFTLVYIYGWILFFFVLGIIALSYGVVKMCKCCCGCNNERPQRDVEAQSYPYYGSRGGCCSYYGPGYWYWYPMWYDPYPTSYGGGTNCCCADCCAGCTCQSSSSSGGSCCSGGGGQCDASGCLRSSGGSGGSGGDALGFLACVAIVIVATIVLVGIFFGLFLLSVLATRIVQRHVSVLGRRANARVQVVKDLQDAPPPPPTHDEIAHRAEWAMEVNENDGQDSVPLLKSSGSPWDKSMKGGSVETQY